MRGKMMGLLLAVATLCVPLFCTTLVSAATDKTSFRYNRISVTYEVQKNGDVKVIEPITL